MMSTGQEAMERSATIWERLTFREETGIAVEEMLSKEPSIAKVVVALDEFDAVTFRETELIRTASDELICNTISVLVVQMDKRLEQASRLKYLRKTMPALGPHQARLSRELK